MTFKATLAKYIGSKIRDERQKNALNQQELAEKIGLTRTSVSNIEAGRQQPTIDVLYQICHNLGKEIHFLLPTFSEVSSLIDNKDGTIDRLKTNKLSAGSIKAIQGILDKHKH